MGNTHQPVVLVTGASSGIGLALARKLWKSDYRVVVTARTSSLARFEDEPFHDNTRFLIRPLEMKISADTADLLFRALFCLIFVGLGAEHVFSDDLIRRLMPAWVPFERAVSIVCGLWLMGWGAFILVGIKLRWAAIALGVFLVVVTAVVHLPGVFLTPGDIHPSSVWMWEVLQRSNLAKNMCLLGVCFHLLHHRLGKYSLENYASQAVGK